jgi:galactonate dehydratase
VKITDVAVILVSHEVGRTWILVRVETDEGISGLGEATLEEKEESVGAAVNEFRRYLIGRDPFHIEHLWQVMYRGRFWIGGPVALSALSGIEQALWDIVGKYLDQPVYNLLGGPCRDRIRVYTHVHGRTPEEYAEAGRELVRRGYTALKYGPWGGPHFGTLTPAQHRHAVQCTAALRDAVGDDVALLVHEHGCMNPATAITVARALEPYRPFWFEEPVQPENVDAMVQVARATKIPIATGERLYTRYGFREFFEKRAVAVAQPDPCHAGGILECKKIAAMAEPYYVTLAPHNPYGPVAVAVSVQLDTNVPNFLIQEYEHWSAELGYYDILLDPPRVENGYIQRPDAPGLGVELDEAAVARYPYKPRDARHALPYEDGTVFGDV